MKVEIVNERTNSSELEFSKNSNVLFGGVCNPIGTVRVSDSAVIHDVIQVVIHDHESP